MGYEFVRSKTKTRRLTIHGGVSISDPDGTLVITEHIFTPGYPPLETSYFGWRAMVLRRIVQILLPLPEVK